MGEEERDAGREGGCIILSAGDERQAGEERSDVISARLQSRVTEKHKRCVLRVPIGAHTQL